MGRQTRRINPTCLDEGCKPRLAGTTTLLHFILSFFLFAFCFCSRAQYAIDWYDVSGGGGSSSSGNYTLRGVVGQPEAGAMASNSYTLQGGFLPGLVETGPPPSVTLSIQLSAGGVAISWQPATPGFVLEETDSLSSPSWSAAPAGNPVTIAASAKTKFYRVKKP